MREFLDSREVNCDKALMLDLAYEEYCLLEEDNGTPPDADSFCARYPSYRCSLNRLLEVHSFVEEVWSDDLEQGGAWPEPGDRIEGCELIRPLGHGALARVFLARNHDLHRFVAIKVCEGRSNEAKTLGPIAHPNIVYVDWVHESFGKFVICMSYQGAATLMDHFDTIQAGEALPHSAMSILQAARAAEPVDGIQNPAPPDDVFASGSYAQGIAKIVSDICHGLGASHDHGVIHGDLKPSNICITATGKAQLLDFNLSLDVRQTTIRYGGTLPYMAPEHIKCVFLENPESTVKTKIDQRVDIYSVGILLWQLLTRELPFPSRNGTGALDNESIQQAYQQRSKLPTIPKTITDPVQQKLLNVALSCMAWNPDHRPQSTELLIECIENSLPNRRTQRRNLIALTLMATTALAASLIPRYVNQGPLGLGYDAMAVGNYDDAIMHFNRAIDMSELSNKNDVLLARGQAFRHTEQFDLAAADFRELRARFDHPSLSHLISHCYLMQGSHRAAELELFAKGGKSQPILHNRTYLQSFNEKGKSCLDFYKESLIKPNTPRELHLRLLMVLFALNTDDEEFVNIHADSTLQLLSKKLSASSWNQPRVYYDMARLNAQLATVRNEAKYSTEAKRCLNRAVRLGWPKDLVASEYLTGLTSQQWFQDISDDLEIVPLSEQETILFPPTEAYRIKQLR